jgi:hypothetical protein
MYEVEEKQWRRKRRKAPAEKQRQKIECLDISPICNRTVRSALKERDE